MLKEVVNESLYYTSRWYLEWSGTFFPLCGMNDGYDLILYPPQYYSDLSDPFDSYVDPPLLDSMYKLLIQISFESEHYAWEAFEVSPDVWENPYLLAMELEYAMLVIMDRYNFHFPDNDSYEWEDRQIALNGYEDKITESVVGNDFVRILT